jgi:hypothetical protein
MVDIDDGAAFEQPANEIIRELGSARGAKLPDIVAFELRRHSAERAHTDETVAARAESFLDLMRSFFARKA